MVNTAFEFSENNTSPEVCVTLTDVMAGLDREVNVSVEVMDGTATEGKESQVWLTLVVLYKLLPGLDFNVTENLLTFTKNGTEMCLNISIIDDDRVEYDETFNITLTVDNPLDTINGNSTTSVQIQITIQDNDSKYYLLL